MSYMINKSGLMKELQSVRDDAIKSAKETLQTAFAPSLSQLAQNKLYDYENNEEVKRFKQLVGLDSPVSKVNPYDNTISVDARAYSELQSYASVANQKLYQLQQENNTLQERIVELKNEIGSLKRQLYKTEETSSMNTNYLWGQKTDTSKIDTTNDGDDNTFKIFY